MQILIYLVFILLWRVCEISINVFDMHFFLPEIYLYWRTPHWTRRSSPSGADDDRGSTRLVPKNSFFVDSIYFGFG